MRVFGLVVVVGSILIPTPWFWALGQNHEPLAVFSQYTGSVALILMGIAQLLATRWPGLEVIFGGLDRIYVLHKWLGISAMAAVLVHDTVDADILGIRAETVLSNLAETAGEISLYGLLILIILSIATFVPYHLWKYTHKLMGAFFAASAFHFAFILRPFELSNPVGLYVLGCCILGIISYLYTLVPFGTFQGKQLFRVAAYEKTGEDISKCRVYFCGPEAMRETLSNGFRRLGLRPAHFFFEEFEIRSGIGLRKLLGFFLPKLAGPLGTKNN